jgi:hypothetical protein
MIERFVQAGFLVNRPVVRECDGMAPDNYNRGLSVLIKRADSGPLTSDTLVVIQAIESWIVRTHFNSPRVSKHRAIQEPDSEPHRSGHHVCESGQNEKSVEIRSSNECEPQAVAKLVNQLNLPGHVNPPSEFLVRMQFRRQCGDIALQLDSRSLSEGSTLQTLGRF